MKGIKLLFHVMLGFLGFPWKRDFPLLTSVRSNNPVRTNPLPHTHNWALFALASLRASELPSCTSEDSLFDFSNRGTISGRLSWTRSRGGPVHALTPEMNEFPYIRGEEVRL